MKLRYTILYVDHVAETLAFYEKAFGLTRLMLHESGTYGELATGDTKLAFAEIDFLKSIGKTPARPDKSAPTFEIALETDDVARAFDHAVASGAGAAMAPTEMPWGQVISYVTDPNGFWVEICSPVG